MKPILIILALLGALYRIFNRFSHDKDVYDDDDTNPRFPYKQYVSKNWDNWVRVVVGGLLGYFVIPIVYYFWTKENLFTQLEEIEVPQVQAGYAIVSGYIGSLVFDKLFNKTKEL